MSLSFLYPTALYALLLLPALLALPFSGRRAWPRTITFWLGWGLRAIILLCMILSLAGVQLVSPVNHTTVVFVLDRSDSVPPQEQRRAQEFIRAAIAEMKTGDRAAIVAFGEDALVDRLASEETLLAPIVSIPRTTHTNLAGALRLALALFPQETHKRIVLLSDGLENIGRANDVVELAAARGVQIDALPLSPPTGQAEVLVDELHTPSAVRLGQAFEATAVLYSTLATPATVRLFSAGRLLATRTVDLPGGETRVAFPLTADQDGFQRYSIELQAAADTLAQNNTASAFTVVHGPPHVLVIESTSEEEDNLVTALESAKIEVTRKLPADLPDDLMGLLDYDAIFLVNVSKDTLPDAADKLLAAYVRDVGGGLVMVGGDQSFGAGKYLRSDIEAALPVDMDTRSRTQEPNLALVFAIDKSGSMGKCHCDNPNLQPGQYVRAESGLSKVDIAKDAVLQATLLLGRTDYVGVVAFDANALWALRLQPLLDAAEVGQHIGGLNAAGQTNIFAGLSEAEAALAQQPARLKHVILVTDGWSNAGQYEELARKMQAEGMTLSIVAAGGGSAPYLEQLAQLGGGRYYAAPTMTDVPQLFFKETIQAVGSYIIEEPFYPIPAGVTPILRGIDTQALPGLYGYNGTTPKQTALVSLVTERGDPLLATWQYGLGRAAVWTSDLKGQWGREWAAWDKFNAFIAQLTNWVMPQPVVEGLDAAFRFDGAQASIEVTAYDKAGRPRDFAETTVNLIGPDLISQTIALAPIGPGRYGAELPVTAPGAYLMHVYQRGGAGQPSAHMQAGWVMPYSPEYKIHAALAGEQTLQALVRATSGQMLTEPGQAFAPMARPTTHAQPIWPGLLTLAALLFPCDVAARRLRLARADGERLLVWVQSRLMIRRPGAAIAPRPRVLGNLFTARERANRRTNLPPAPDAPPLPPSAPPPAPIEEASPLAEPADMAERLRRAKERARKSR